MLTSKELIEIFGGINVLLFVAGLSLMEGGRSRKKNLSSALTRQLACLFLSVTAFWIMGYAFAFGTGNFLIGYDDHFALHETNQSTLSHFFLHSTISSLPSSILGGAVAERTHFTGLLALAPVLSGLIYPAAAHWVWSPQGWLRANAYIDVGGVLPVHILSGVVSLVACAIVGRRMEKFGSKYRKEIHGHSLPMAYIGGTLIMFGMLGKSVGLAVFFPQISIGKVVANCMISGAGAGSLSIILYKISVTKNTGYELTDMSQNGGVRVTNRRWSFYCCLNGCLAGMVAIQGGVGSFPGWGAWVIGLVAGCLYFLCQRIMVFCRLDDVTEAIPVHLSAGIISCLITPLIADKEVFDGDTKYLVGWAAAGLAAVTLWTAVISAVIMLLLLLIRKLRVDVKVESVGADVFKMEEQAYPSGDKTDCDVTVDGTFYFQKCPGLSPIKKVNKPVGSVQARTAVVYPCSPSDELSSTRRIDVNEIKELARSVPKIIVEDSKEKKLLAVKIPNPPPLPNLRSSSLASDHPTILAPPSSPALSTSTQVSISSNKAVPMNITVDELRITLKEQKKRLKATTELMRRPSNTLMERDRLSKESSCNDSVHEPTGREIASKFGTFNYLQPVEREIAVKTAVDDVFEDNDNSNIVEAESGFGDSLQSHVISTCNAQSSPIEMKKITPNVQNISNISQQSGMLDPNVSELI